MNFQLVSAFVSGDYAFGSRTCGVRARQKVVDRDFRSADRNWKLVTLAPRSSGFSSLVMQLMNPRSALEAEAETVPVTARHYVRLNDVGSCPNFYS